MSKKVIHVAKHIPTGALIPIVINKVDNNIIQDYEEYTKDRKSFTLSMLQNKWDMDKDTVIELLQKYDVPGYIIQKEISQNQLKQIDALDIAIFFEEYIYGIEQKEKIKHKKLKSKIKKVEREH
jgi:hypothetical protein